MPGRPRLKSAMTAICADGSLLLNLDPRRRIELEDPDGVVLALLSRLAEGTRTVEELARAQSVDDGARRSRGDRQVTVAELEVISSSSTSGAGWRTPTRRRCSANRSGSASPATWPSSTRSPLAFHDGARGRADREQIQRRLTPGARRGARGRRARVLRPENLAGLGVGAVTVVDSDVVELRNFARQFTYSPTRSASPRPTGWRSGCGRSTRRCTWCLPAPDLQPGGRVGAAARRGSGGVRDRHSRTRSTSG